MIDKMPPLGVMPKWRWVELNPNPSRQDLINRQKALDEALDRFRVAKREYPLDWSKEWSELEVKLTSNK